MGSVFSPYYAWAGRRDPLNHAAVNVALYRKGSGRWALTERGRQDVSQSADALRIGPSSFALHGDVLDIEVDEVGCPVPRTLRGRVRLIPEVRTGHEVVIAEDGDHRWWPIAPRARVEVHFDTPAVRWSGNGYFDCNWGAAPLEDAFHAWIWSRARLGSGAAVLYDMWPREGPQRTMALRFDAAGAVHPFEPPAMVSLPRSLFGLARRTRSESEASLVRTLTDAHFYVRSVVRLSLCGEPVLGVHEMLSLDRFRAPWAKLLLPFRMPRNPGA